MTQKILLSTLFVLMLVSLPALAEIENRDITVDDSSIRSAKQVCIQVNGVESEKWNGCYDLLPSFQEINMVKGSSVADEGWTVDERSLKVLSPEWQEKVSLYEYSRIKHLAFNWGKATSDKQSAVVPFYLRYQFHRTTLDQGTHFVLGQCELKLRPESENEYDIVLRFYDESGGLEEVGQLITGILFDLGGNKNGKQQATKMDAERLSGVVVPALRYSLMNDPAFLELMASLLGQGISQP
jgi:hypothetical protein